VRLDVLRGRIRIRFEDQGIGVSASDLPDIFERFYRAGSRPSGETRSGGLGLAIAQALVAAQGGTIICPSVLGRGSTFTISLPLWSDPVPAPGAATGIRSESDSVSGDGESLLSPARAAAESPSGEPMTLEAKREG
jgi:hypothetical protein